MKTHDLNARHWPLIAALISAFMLAAAHAFETFGKLFPCPLCLQQREAYWIALTIGVTGLIAQRLRPNLPLTRVANILLGFAFIYACGIAVFHSAVEFGWLKTGCSSVGLDTGALRSLDQPMVVGRCDERTVMFFNISMANLNALAALTFAGISLFFAVKSPRK